MMHINPYLAFDGTCREAFTFYAELLGGEIEAFITTKEMPMEGAGDEWGDRILHAKLVADSNVIMGGDTPPGVSVKPTGTCVYVGADSPAEVERIYHALADGGRVDMPISPTPWSAMFGMVTDRFGTPWIIDCGPQD
jgi:PhnB protein